MPVGTLGVIVLVVGLALPFKEESKQIELKTETDRKIENISWKRLFNLLGAIGGLLIVGYMVLYVLITLF